MCLLCECVRVHVVVLDTIGTVQRTAILAKCPVVVKALSYISVIGYLSVAEAGL